MSASIGKKHLKFAIFGLGNFGRQFEQTRHNVGFSCIDQLFDRFVNHSSNENQYSGSFLSNAKSISKCKFVTVSAETKRFSTPPKQPPLKKAKTPNPIFYKNTLEIVGLTSSNNNSTTSTNDKLDENSSTSIIESEKCTLYLVQPHTFMNASGSGVRGFIDYFKIPIKNILIVTDDLNLPQGKIRLKRKGSSGGQNGLKSVEKFLGTNKYDRLRLGIGHSLYEGQTIVYHKFVLQKFTPDEQQVMKKSVELAAKACVDWLENGTEHSMALFNGQQVDNEEIN